MINFKGLERCTTCMQRIADAGHVLRYVDNVLQVSDEVAVQEIIDSFTLEDARAPIIIEIKLLARKKILAFLPEWKQSNYNARMNELNRIRADRAWSEAEQAEIIQMQAIWDQAKAIRSASDQHEANLGALSSFEQIASYDFSTNWP